jgi:hypothetical protein
VQRRELYACVSDGRLEEEKGVDQKTGRMKWQKSYTQKQDENIPHHRDWGILLSWIQSNYCFLFLSSASC